MASGRIKLVHLVSALTLGFSLPAIAGSAIHLAVPLDMAVDNLFGILYLLSLTAIILLIYLDDRFINRENYLGRRLHRRGYICLAAMIAGFAMLACLNMLTALI